MDHDRVRRPLRRPQGPRGPPAGRQVVLLTGVASLILGVLVLVRPDATLLAAGVLFGVHLLISGVLQLVAAFGTHRTTALRVLAFISGALSLLLGPFCLRGPMRSVLLLTLWIGIGWLIRGITQTLAAASDRSMPARGRQIFLGALTFAAGIVLIDSPSNRSPYSPWSAASGWAVRFHRAVRNDIARPSTPSVGAARHEHCCDRVNPTAEVMNEARRQGRRPP